MAAARDLCRLAPWTVAAADDLAAAGRRALRREPRRGPAAVAAQAVYAVPTEVLAAARDLAGGDLSRVRLGADGSAVVFNSPAHRLAASW